MANINCQFCYQRQYVYTPNKNAEITNRDRTSEPQGRKCACLNHFNFVLVLKSQGGATAGLMKQMTAN